jgi:RimJ/RimL family protein N-acetyltransferase
MGGLRKLETGRLSMAPHERRDFDDSAALWADPAVTRHIGGAPSTREEAWSRMLRNAGHWALQDYGYWTVRETRTGRFVGEVGFADLKREISPGFDGAPEIGWVIAPAAQGQGFASEAVAAALRWGDSILGWDLTVCMIAPDNAPSLRVAAKAGFTRTTRTAYKGKPVIVFGRRRGAEHGMTGEDGETSG